VRRHGQRQQAQRRGEAADDVGQPCLISLDLVELRLRHLHLRSRLAFGLRLLGSHAQLGLELLLDLDVAGPSAFVQPLLRAVDVASGIEPAPHHHQHPMISSAGDFYV
jgi:hypothetical protein